jgi:hypothetical protein
LITFIQRFNFSAEDFGNLGNTAAFGKIQMDNLPVVGHWSSYSDFENFTTVALQNDKLVTSKSGQFSTQHWEQPLPGESIFDFTVASNLGQTNPSTVGTPNDAGLSNCL